MIDLYFPPLYYASSPAGAGHSAAGGGPGNNPGVASGDFCVTIRFAGERSSFRAD
jgi:hypothetical protein